MCILVFCHDLLSTGGRTEDTGDDRSQGSRKESLACNDVTYAPSPHPATRITGYPVPVQGAGGNIYNGSVYGSPL